MLARNAETTVWLSTVISLFLIDVVSRCLLRLRQPAKSAVMPLRHARREQTAPAAATRLVVLVCLLVVGCAALSSAAGAKRPPGGGSAAAFGNPFHSPLLNADPPASQQAILASVLNNNASLTSCKPTGQISDARCDYETVEMDINSDNFFPILDKLRRETFFRLYKVDLYRDCPFWNDNSLCMSPDCTVSKVDEVCDQSRPFFLLSPGSSLTFVSHSLTFLQNSVQRHFPLSKRRAKEKWTAEARAALTTTIIAIIREAQCRPTLVNVLKQTFVTGKTRIGRQKAPG